ncbi:hypothetical protein [Streptomyces sp. NPDC046821]|uniref:hypothetical protein n=1 Tax=Streptomyces sp. NPDC046821 TaxID=3154702 RepID=UPI0033F031E6
MRHRARTHVLNHPFEQSLAICQVSHLCGRARSGRTAGVGDQLGAGWQRLRHQGGKGGLQSAMVTGQDPDDAVTSGRLPQLLVLDLEDMNDPRELLGLGAEEVAFSPHPDQVVLLLFTRLPLFIGEGLRRRLSGLDQGIEQVLQSGVLVGELVV